jgi:hypothetical protein
VRFDQKTAGRIAAGQITLLIHPKPVTAGGHSITYERKRTWEDPKHKKGLLTIQQPVCRVRVTEVDLRPIDGIGYEEARAAGFANLDLFRAAWDENQKRVWVARFELLEEHDPIKLLGRGGGYTSSSFLTIDEEVEAVSTGVQAALTKEARTFDELRAQRRRETWARERDAMRLDERYRQEVERARLLGTDVSREEAAMRRALENMQRKNDRRAA